MGVDPITSGLVGGGIGKFVGKFVGNAGDKGAGIEPTNTEMTPEQRAALEEQRKGLVEQRTQLLQVLKDQNLLQPALLESLGFKKGADGQYSDTVGQQFGDLQGQQAGAQSDLLDIQKQQFGDLMASSPEMQQLNSLYRQRQIEALQGNSQADPELERNLGLQEQTLRNQLQAQLGPGYETSTPGIQALNDFRQRAESLRFQSRQGIISNYATAGNTSANTMGAIFNTLNPTSTAITANANAMGTTGNVASNRFANVFNAANLTVPASTALGGNAAGYTPLANSYFNQTQLGTNAQLTQEQTRGNTGSKIFGSILGMF